MEEKDTYSLETVINTLKGKDVKTQLHILFDTIDSLKENRRAIESKYKKAKSYINCNINGYINAMLLYNNLKTISMYIEYLDSYLEELISKSNGKAEIFQSVVKGSNFFTPIVDSYYTIGNHIVELSCSEKGNRRGRYDKIINGITFKGKYGVTVITNEGDGWKRNIELDKLCDSRDEAIKYIKSLNNA